MMRLSIIVCFLSLALAACGDESGTPATKKDVSVNRGGAAATNASQPVTSGPTQSPNAVAVDNSNATSQNSLMAAKARKIDAIRQAGSGPSALKTDVETLLRQSARPAPENSEFSVALTEILTERRTFLDHPTLARVEKVTDGSRSAIKIFTTDGRTIDLPGRAIEKISVASSASILKAGGLAVPPPRPERKTGGTDRN